MITRMRLILPFLLFPLILASCTKTRVNTPPVAYAGIDQNVFVRHRVDLDATGSVDPDGDPLLFKWTIASKPLDSRALIEDDDQPIGHFFPDTAGDYVIQLEVSDGIETSIDTLTCMGELNEPPIANAGPDQPLALITDRVFLDGSLSYDPNLRLLTYRWELSGRPDGSMEILFGADTATPYFDPDLPGVYTCTLIVNDGSLDSDPDYVIITVN